MRGTTTDSGVCSKLTVSGRFRARAISPEASALVYAPNSRKGQVAASLARRLGRGGQVFRALAVRNGAHGAVQHPHLVEVKELACTGAGIKDPDEVEFGDDGQDSAAAEEPVFPQGFYAIAWGQLRTAVHDGWSSGHAPVPSWTYLCSHHCGPVRLPWRCGFMTFWCRATDLLRAMKVPVSGSGRTGGADPTIGVDGPGHGTPVSARRGTKQRWCR